MLNEEESKARTVSSWLYPKEVAEFDPGCEPEIKGVGRELGQVPINLDQICYMHTLKSFRRGFVGVIYMANGSSLALGLEDYNKVLSEVQDRMPGKPSDND